VSVGDGSLLLSGVGASAEWVLATLDCLSRAGEPLGGLSLRLRL